MTFARCARHSFYMDDACRRGGCLLPQAFDDRRDERGEGAPTVTILVGDARDMLATLPAESVHCCVTSPPYYGLRDYGVAGQLGLEETPDAYVAAMVDVFREVRRVLRNDGTLWLNIGDSFASGGGTGMQGKRGQRFDRRHTQETLLGTRKWPDRGLKPKDLIGIPWLLAFALRADGWFLRSDIIWHKPNPMPESVRDRPTSAHEHIFLLAKSERYFFDADAVKETAVSDHASGNGFKRLARRSYGGDSQQLGRRRGEQWSDVDGRRNIRNVWSVATRPFKGAHFATFPPALIEPCIKAGSPVGGVVLDPFFGAGTSGLVAQSLGRACVGIELNPEYAALAEQRIAAARPKPVAPDLFSVSDDNRAAKTGAATLVSADARLVGLSGEHQKSLSDASNVRPGGNHEHGKGTRNVA